jgi:prevent-host-death family protein
LEIGMRTVSAREANQGFSQLLGEAASGQEIVITRHGKPIATLAPFVAKSAEVERLAAVERLKAFFSGSPAAGRARRFTREEMHER